MIAYRADAFTLARMRVEQARIVAIVAAMPPAPPPEPTVPVMRLRVPVARIITMVAFEMGLAEADVTGHSREARLFRARAAIAWLARIGTGRSIVEIGRALGGRDHTTIFSALKRAKSLRADDPAFAAVTTKLLGSLAEANAE